MADRRQAFLVQPPRMVWTCLPWVRQGPRQRIGAGKKWYLAEVDGPKMLSSLPANLKPRGDAELCHFLLNLREGAHYGLGPEGSYFPGAQA